MHLFRSNSLKRQKKEAAKSLNAMANQPTYNPFTSQTVVGQVTQNEGFERQFTISKSLVKAKDFSKFKLSRETSDVLPQVTKLTDAASVNINADEQAAAQATLSLLLTVPTKYFK
ncbi:hypothetical protein [Lactiplantibacillus plantarum]|uniref:hypothetical protein n=1 Tax=Lactiplantibacillus plantarum TaxID=1590 RepID=UPI001BA9691E|nr:hypothetical protein [Lactiplantibacillus plantarum]MBS0954966.1 hypothetical protein [Lactiplantibacillus plantarum]